jgi:hypothetical protein
MTASVPRRAIAVGDSMVLTATMSDGSAPAGAQWTSSDRAKASVTPQGVLRGVSEGTVTLVVRSGTLRDSVRVDVTPRAVALPTPPAQQTTSATPPPVVTPPKDSTPPVTGRASDPPTSSRASENASAENSVRSLVNDFAAALTSRKIDEVVKLYPTMPKKDQDSWKSIFGFLKDFRATYRVETVSINSGSATVRAAGQHVYTNPDTKKSCALPVTIDMSASESSRGWRVTAFTQNTKERC